jgi:hypothetical protein
MLAISPRFFMMLQYTGISEAAKSAAIVFNRSGRRYFMLMQGRGRRAHVYAVSPYSKTSWYVFFLDTMGKKCLYDAAAPSILPATGSAGSIPRARKGPPTGAYQ